MYAEAFHSRWFLWLLVFTVYFTPRPADAQEHEHAAPASQQQPDPDHADHAQHADHAGASPLFPMREASGTAWLPDVGTMHAVHGQAGAWELMAHGSAFAQFLYEGGEDHRRSHQGGSINWLMGMARRAAGVGRIGLRGMVSLEPWTIPGCGYPDLLATGETCAGDSIHDRQHPHELFMEVAVGYDRPLGPGVRWQVYGGPVGEPALGPAGFPHRASASPNPIAPIGHHWLDATHIAFGVITTGLYTQRWKAEASVFNGREPDEDRADMDFAALDSYSGRLSFMLTSAIALQMSLGRLNDAEVLGSLPPVDVRRVTASATFHRALSDGLWATTLAWGANAEKDQTSHAVMLESSAALNGHDTLFGRFEIVGKPAHDLHVHEATGVFTVGKVQLGYTRYLTPRSGLQAGFGASISAGIVPAALEPRYGGRVIPGFGVFLTLRPAAHSR